MNIDRIESARVRFNIMVRKSTYIMFFLIFLTGLNAYAGIVGPGEYIGGDAAFVPHAAWQPGGTFVADSSGGQSGWGTRAPRRTVNGHSMTSGGTHGLLSTGTDSGWLGLLNNNGGNGGNPAGQTGDAWISYEFDDVYPLGLMHVWNWNSGANPGGSEFVGGIRDVTIDYSEDGISWTTLGQVTFPQAPDAADYAGVVGPDFGGMPAKFVVITMADPNGWPQWITGEASTKHGLGEVAFNVTVPDTANLTINVIVPPGATIPTNLQPPAGVNQVFVDTPVNLSAAQFVQCPEVLAFKEWTGAGIANPKSENTTITISADQTITVEYVDNRECGDECHGINVRDIDGNCLVDLFDFKLFGDSWMHCSQPACDGI